MKRCIIGVCLTAAALPAERLETKAQVVTAWYQPTSYPAKKFDGSAMPEDIKVVHVWGGWFGNSFYKMLVQNSSLWIGGKGSTYTSPIKFDITGLPVNPDLVNLYLHALPSGSANPSQVSLWRINTTWLPSTTGWDKFPYVSYPGYYWPVSTVVNGWRWYTITGWYNDWKSGTHSDNGILIWPYNNDDKQRFDRFASSRVSSPTDASRFSLRPLLRLDFTPTLWLQMPLPGNHQWLVTTEVGGYDCTGEYDQAHDGLNYFSIDFSWRNVADAGATVYTEASDIPVLAAEGGRVLAFLNDPNNGNYVVVTHGSTGFTTRYLHLKSIVVVSATTVVQGDTLGYMGNTGLSDGVHLHFGIRYNNSGAATVPELTKVLLNGWLLKNFQTECSVNEKGVPQDPPIRYYRSSSKAY